MSEQNRRASVCRQLVGHGLEPTSKSQWWADVLATTRSTVAVASSSASASLFVTRVSLSVGTAHTRATASWYAVIASSCSSLAAVADRMEESDRRPALDGKGVRYEHFERVVRTAVGYHGDRLDPIEFAGAHEHEVGGRVFDIPVVVTAEQLAAEDVRVPLAENDVDADFGCVVGDGVFDVVANDLADVNQHAESIGEHSSLVFEGLVGDGVFGRCARQRDLIGHLLEPDRSDLTAALGRDIAGDPE